MLSIFNNTAAVVILSLAVAVGSQANSKRPVEVKIDGLPDEVRDVVLPGLGVSRLEGEVTEAVVRRQVRRGEKQIVESLQAFGLYRARVTSELTRRGEAGWLAVYQVDPGPVVKYAEVDVEVTGPAADEPTVRKFIKRFPIKTGDALEHKLYEATKQELLNLVTERGYLQAELAQSRIELDLDRYRAALVLRVASGPLMRFGDIKLLQDSLNDGFLNKYVDIAPGEPYSFERLLKLESALRDSQYFRSVKVEPRFGEIELDRVPVDIELTPAKPSKYTFGLGFGTDTGVRGSAGWERRRVNRRGHRFQSSVQLSQIGTTLDLRYIIPFRNPRNDQYSVFATYRNEDPDEIDSEYGRAGVTRSVLLGRSRWDTSLIYQREAFTVADQSDTVDMLIPRVGFSRVVADNRLVTRQGLLTELSLQGSHDSISDVEFLQFEARGKLIRTLGKRHRFIGRGQFAYSLASDVQELPASLRFFAGGDQSVRGFAYKSIGPEDDEGEVIGGRHLIVGSAEYDIRLSKAWRLATFFDAGNAFDDFDEALEKSVGLGVRWITPIGPLRVDLAQPIGSSEGSLRLHIYLGPDL